MVRPMKNNLTVIITRQRKSLSKVIVEVALILTGTTTMIQSSSKCIILKAKMILAMVATKKGIKMFSGVMEQDRVIAAKDRKMITGISLTMASALSGKMIIRVLRLLLAELSLNNLAHNLL